MNPYRTVPEKTVEPDEIEEIVAFVADVRAPTAGDVAAVAVTTATFGGVMAWGIASHACLGAVGVLALDVLAQVGPFLARTRPIARWLAARGVRP